ncbi:MAG: hypothetical protein OEX19_07760 [Gammaproteobacteria bacterium]|nr:hypothetical protein [Gammaproteobacteria bacterium]
MSTSPIDSGIDELALDIEKCVLLLDKEDSQFYRRTYVRALFAYLEGFAYMTRQFAIEMDQITYKRFGVMDWDRHFLLHDEIPSIGNNGKITKQSNRVSFIDHFAFSLKAHADVVGYKGDILADNGWQSLKGALKIRHRLTHPKKSVDVQVTDEDIQLCKSGYNWFSKLIVITFRKSFEEQQV